MKRLVLITCLALAFMFSNMSAQEAKKTKMAVPAKPAVEQKKDAPKAAATKENKKDKKAGKAIKGTLASICDIRDGKDVKLSTDEAGKLIEKGTPLVLKVGTGKKATIYFILNSDGTYAAKNMSKYAGKTISVTGKTMKSNGMNFIVASQITGE